MRFDARLTRRLEAFARREGATLHMVLLAGYAASLGRWSGQTDFAVGTPVANRRSAEAESLVGFFVNTLPVRARLGGRGLTFRGLVGRVREASLGAYANQDVPFERVVEALDPDRAFGHTPVVQTLFALQNAPVGEIALPGLTLVYDEPETGTTRFDVELFLAETPGGLEGNVNFDTELFERETVGRFVENLMALFEAAVDDPDRALGEVAGLAPAQARRVLVDWNARRVDYGDQLAVHALVEAWADRTPDAVAARLGDETIAYAELDRRANRLARYVRRAGGTDGALVAVCVERSIDVLVALLATMKAGAAYVPVDPEYPSERIALVLDDADAAVVLTRSSVAARLPETRARIVRLDADRAEIDLEDDERLDVAVSPEALVYSAYTSGSTGKPKGVAMTHRAISNLLSFQRRDSATHGALRTLQFASLSFDVSFQEIFSTLTAGGEVVLVGDAERRDVSRLVEIVDERGVERVFVPFVALDQFAEAAVAEGRLPRALREIDTAGEQLKITPSIRAFFTAAPECRLVNHYGPSETHLVTTHALEGDPATWPELPPIGSPIANAPVYVLDADLRPVAAGVPGELYVGGAGLARGYHARPDLTAEAFVPDPFADEAGARMYRTGDLARFRSDGVLEFLGRRDLQVKVRGYRVEPGEIESALARHPAVRAVAVAARDGRTGKRLAAYVVFEEGASATVETLRAFCATTLPEFMVPSAFVALDALPVSPNGKVDRGALPEPEWAATTASVAPRTPAEEVVCGAFAEALGLDRVGATDDFFELGGHSLLATSVISRVRRAFGVEVPLRALFESPTPAGVAAAALAARGVAPLPPVERASDEDRRALSYAQRRLWFLDRLEPGLAVYNVPAAIRLDGALDVVALERALAELVRRHESLRTRFVEGPDGPEQLVDPATSFLVECDDVSGGADPESEAERIVAGEATRPFDLARGPVLRTRLIRIGDESHVLSLVVHHISADGWSVGILVRELGALYLAYVEGRESTLAEPALQYGDWAAWQRAWIEGGELDRQLAYWRSELEDAPAALDVPTDRARSATATWRGSTFDVELPSDLGGRLARLARAEGATLHMVLLAAYAWTLMRHAGARDVVVGVPVANRRAVEAEALVGFFVNTLAVRVRGNGDRLTFRDLLARVREASLRAYANQDVPFERVVEAARPERALNRAPLFQTAFALQNARVPELELPGLRVRAVDTETETSKFDLMLTLEEREAGLGGAVEYNTDLFDRETISDVVTHFASVLAAVAAEPGRPLDEIPLDAVGAKRAFAAWSVGSATLESSALVHERFESVAARTPDALALARGDETRTYAEVEASANRLAHHLRALGVGAESRVAIALDRGPDAVVALLAVLKAGGAYVPLEPGQPAERLRALVEDCAAKVVITESRHGAAFDGASARVVAIDRVADEIASRPASRLEPFARPGSLAYVIFTSGSTGRPKGVGVEHRSLAAYTSAAIRRLEIEPGWRFLVVSTLAADLGNTSIFPALTTGGCLDLLPPDLAFDPTGVETYAAARPYDALKIVPSHLAALLGGARPEHVLPRNLLVLGGEATTGATLDALARLAPACRVAIHYGPTETTVGAIAGVVGPGDVARSTGPLGRPLAGTRVYVLDDRLEPVPPGVPGAIHVGGAGVARGYVGAAAATASAFLPDPFADEPGARMYRTGDRARWLRDGRVEFLGRADAQLKIRGYRVEPGEVEVAILSHPDVRAAVAVARKDAAGGVRLAAYVVADPRLAPSLGGLARRHVANGLAFAELNRNETDYIAREIFELGAYVRNGVTLRDGDTIVDVGANAGLFTAFASLACRPARVLAVEPNPRLARVLRANVAAYAPNAEIVEAALSDRDGPAAFTFFRGFSLLSGLYADAEVERSVVASFVENRARSGEVGADALAREADALLAERFETETFDVSLRRLSDVLAERHVERVNLLKVNVEKAELDVLRGIDERDWERIDQAVVEVDVAANLSLVVALFEGHGFDVRVEQDVLLDRTDLCYVYAVRRGSGRALVAGAGPSVVVPPSSAALVTADALREHVARSLPEYMRPATWTFLDALPLTANGKLDRARLPEPASESAAFVAPRGDLEREVAEIWADALGVERVGAHDNFFDLGGHSLLLARVHARLVERLGVDLSVVELFRHPTVAALAARLARGGEAAPTAAADRDRGARRRSAARGRAGARAARSGRTDANDGEQDE